MKIILAKNQIEEYDLKARFCKDDYVLSGRGTYDTEVRVRSILESLELRPGHNVLDIGVGSGLLFQYIHDKVKECHGVEPTPALVKRLQNKFKDMPGIFMHLGRSDQLPFPDRSFDIIVMNAVVYGFPNREILVRSLNEIRRVARDDSTIYIGEVPITDESQIDTLQGNALIRAWKKIRRLELTDLIGGLFRKSIRHMRYLMNQEPRILESGDRIHVSEKDFLAMCNCSGLNGYSKPTMFKYGPIKSRLDYVLKPETSVSPVGNHRSVFNISMDKQTSTEKIERNTSL